MTTFRYRIPGPPLRDFVSMIWLWEGVTRPHQMERLMPTGEGALIVNLKDDTVRMYDKDTLGLSQTTRGAVMVGVHAEPMVIDCDEQESVFGVQFRAGGSFPFFGMPADEGANLHVGLEEVWGRPDATGLRDELLEAGGCSAKFDVAERYLLARLAVDGRHPAVNFALGEVARKPHAVTMSSLVDATGLSARRFIQLFRTQVGLTPKAFQRVRRFQQVIRTVYRSRENAVDWAELAVASGYYDQSHLIHDFRELSGMNPAAYLKCATEHLNHVPIGST